MNRLLLATSNPDKVTEWRALAPDVEWWVSPGLPVPDETGLTTIENARIKARAAAAATGSPALGDDVGLWVAAFSGAPGLELKPWAEGLGGWAQARAALTAVSGSRATYRCGLALCWPDGRERVAEGVVEGHLGPPDGEGPGVEPCFFPDGSATSLASMSPEERAATHHRSRAWRHLAPMIRPLGHVRP